MVISYIQPLLLLLASVLVFFLPALYSGTVDFKYCNGIGYPSINITRVTITPGSFADARIFGFTEKTLDAGLITAAVKDGDAHFAIGYYDLCACSDCPILANTNFSLFLFQIIVYRDEYERDEKISVTWTKSMTDATELMCVYFELPDSTSAVSA
ncbi:PREDICTED: uncharacterized protein LOC104719355 [Camelina sativa]|uniref:Uncharacterized protein LOC104719355 n=1 Tax=Camelina sativa TaxID=90675 RepID=A0ABM0U486_CAMSA|nr:PREDICTED: uncharacterized protein LOC104719355 [Camelina sativa]